MAKQEKQIQQKTVKTIVVDGTNLIAGRLSSHVAKLLLDGNRVSIVNCENIMISGSKRNIMEEYKKFLEISSIINPKFGPFHPRRPDTIISKMVRGMLPRKKSSGLSAFKRLRAHIGVPSELKGLDKIQFDDAKITRSVSNYTTMTEFGQNVGWNR
ncbi:MAG: 50S ribosomal protein L13 [Thermoproteota archaeon]